MKDTFLSSKYMAKIVFLLVFKLSCKVQPQQHSLLGNFVIIITNYATLLQSKMGQCKIRILFENNLDCLLKLEIVQLLVTSGHSNMTFNKGSIGQWFWLSWQSGHPQHQRSAVQIQSLANFYKTFVYRQLCWKDENKEQLRQGMAHFKKRKMQYQLSTGFFDMCKRKGLFTLVAEVCGFHSRLHQFRDRNFSNSLW